MHVNRSLILTNRLCTKILLALWMKGQILHRKSFILGSPLILGFNYVFDKKVAYVFAAFEIYEQ